MQLGLFREKGSHVTVEGHEHIRNGREWAEKGKQKETSLMVGHLHIAEWNGISSPSLIYFLIVGKSFESNLSHNFRASDRVQGF